MRKSFIQVLKDGQNLAIEDSKGRKECVLGIMDSMKRMAHICKEVGQQLQRNNDSYVT